MTNNRREFLKLAGLAGVGLAGTGLLNACASTGASAGDVQKQAGKSHRQVFNMSGYAAPKIETVRIGFIGLGQRGPGAVNRINRIDGVDIKGLCDLRPDKVAAVQKKLADSSHKPTAYSGKEDAWKEMVDRDDIDLIYIATPWHLHTPMAVYAMEHGKHVAVEVPAATTLEECWQLVETSERTRKHCMMLENCCYDFFEMLTLNMARQGFFGEIVHGEGAYIHNLVDLNFSKTGYQNMWRLKENYRNGSLYPTHGLGPICQVMNINRGDQMDYLVSVSSNDFTMGETAKKLAAQDSFYKEFADKKYRGNMNTTTIRTKKGRTIMVQHDVSSNAPYSRIHLITGTNGSARKWPLPAKIATSHEKWLSETEFKAIEEKYQPELIRRLGEMAKQVGGHGGMDFLMDWRLIDLLRNGLPLDQDVYDAALWSAIAPLSEWSVANRSNSIDVPDFTGGSWQKNTPVDITFRGGGTTNVKI
ncbi:glycosyl hydrolase family 109 protein 1 [Adhaeribacter aerolatus]|uniref:Glycosyl hydrolase family 109 protein 1 n=1 Tax=Adhaeribacter aerolatus TaxID=670289 RepID=A0A512AXU4_9BACT|nr:Gfo/Idh/MocA family oxidoreductase [Adhaeribacter aerolatus]GEO04545.1 glycosyl hydrolase family 109 protein 1 [Adhaeribacter aerolatus]